MVTRTRDKQVIVRLTEDEKTILDDFCEAYGIDRSRVFYDLIEKMREGEYKY